MPGVTVFGSFPFSRVPSYLMVSLKPRKALRDPASTRVEEEPVISRKLDRRRHLTSWFPRVKRTGKRTAGRIDPPEAPRPPLPDQDVR